jgi:hypothetical protein
MKENQHRPAVFAVTALMEIPGMSSFSHAKLSHFDSIVSFHFHTSDQYRYIKTKMWGFYPDEIAAPVGGDSDEKQDFPQLPGAAD